MSDGFTRLKDIKLYNVRYQPTKGYPAFWDCPKVIRDAACGQAPRRIERSIPDIVQAMWPHLLIVGILFSTAAFLQMLAWKLRVPHSWCALGVPLTFLIFPPLAVRWMRQSNAQYEKLLALFKLYPEVYRDEIFKWAVYKLPLVDFAGRHRGHQPNAKIGRFEGELVAKLKNYGIEVETTVANRGRPFVIHQYELTELEWGKWPNGDTKNYTLDLAILWPERRIKYNIEVDDSSHGTSERLGKDINRDKVLTERGWFVRRLNHKFLSDEEKTQQAMDEIVAIIFYFAKYADDQEFDYEKRWDARIQNQRLKKDQERLKLVRTTASLPAAEQAAKTAS